MNNYSEPLTSIKKQQSEAGLDFLEPLLNYLPTYGGTLALPLTLYQTSRVAGEGGDDIVRLGLSTNQIVQIAPSLKKFHEKYRIDSVEPNKLFEMMQSMLEYFSVGDLEASVLKMLDNFKNGNGKQFSDPTLNKKARENEIMLELDAAIRMRINKMASVTQGDLVRHGTSGFGSLKDHTRPKFNSILDTLLGMKIAVNDVWSFRVELVAFKYKHGLYRATFKITLYDHFGLDKQDIKKFGFIDGMCAWFILQHSSRFAFRPFITVMENTYETKGNV
ncbi:MAG: DUF3289 family protein [Candidatus Thiodiazotropha taylori]